MIYLSQVLIITAISLVGEVLQRVIPLPIPASVYGIVLLFAALCLKLIRLEQVKQVGGFLTSILPILFVSPMVGILEHWGMIRNALIPIAVLVLVSTAVIFAISGRVTQALLGKGDEEK